MGYWAPDSVALVVVVAVVVVVAEAVVVVVGLVVPVVPFVPVVPMVPVVPFGPVVPEVELAAVVLVVVGATECKGLQVEYLWCNFVWYLQASNSVEHFQTLHCMSHYLP